MKKYLFITLFLSINFIINAQTSPEASDNTVSTDEDTNYIFSFLNFGYNDAESHDCFHVRLRSNLNGDGILFLDANNSTFYDAGEELGFNDEITKIDIDLNKLRYKPDLDDNGVADANFDFDVDDVNGDGYGGNYTITINTDAVNDIPSFTNSGGNQTVAEDAGLQTVNNWATAIVLGPANETPPQTATFSVTNNTNIALFNGAGQQPAISPAGVLTFESDFNANGSATITVVLNDGGGTANGGVNTSPAQTFTINVTAVNDLPTAADNTLTCNENSFLPFSTTNFNYSDVEGDPMTQIQIVFVPALGTLWDDADGDNVIDGAEITYANSDVVSVGLINANRFKYMPAPDENGSPYTSFVFRVHDGTGYSTSTYTMTINVLPVNSEPYFTIGLDITVTEDAPAPNFPGWATGISQGDNDPAQTITFHITNPTPALFSAGPVVDEATGNLTFTPAADANGSVTIDLWLTDDGGTAIGGDDRSGPPNETFIITISPDNDDPVITNNNPLNINEGDINVVITNTLLLVEDIDNANFEIAFTLLTTPGNGALYKSGAFMPNGSTFTQADIDGRAITYSHNGSENTPETFSFSISDGAGGTALNTTFTINITNVNDAPEFTSLPVETGDIGVAYTYNITTIDADGDPLTISIVNAPAWLSIAATGPGTATLSGTPPSGTPFNNSIIISVSDGIAPPVTQSWNLRISSNVQPNAGLDDETCTNDEYTLNGSAVPVGYTGFWTVIRGAGTFVDDALRNTLVTGLNSGPTPNNINEFRWSFTNGPDTVYDDVIILNNTVYASVVPMVSPVCSDNAIIIANPINPGESGIWTYEGSANPVPVITNPNNITTTVSGLNSELNQFRWTVTKGGCSDFAILDVYNYEVTDVNAGNDETICTDTYNLGGSAPKMNETGLWNVFAGGGTIITPTSNTSQVTNIQRGVNTFQWTVSHANCSSSDLVDITNLSVEAVINTFDPSEACVEPHPLQANSAASQFINNPNTVAIGTWTVEAGGGIVNAINAHNTTVSNLDPGNNSFIWTMTNGVCTDSDTIIVINNIPTVADAGLDTIVCSTSLPSLSANSNYDAFRETAFWRVVQGAATINTPSLYNSSVANLDFYCSEWSANWWTTVNAPNIFEWVIQRGSCESTDQVRVLNGIPGVIDAGIDQTVCDNQVNLDALDEGSCAHEVFWTSPVSSATVIDFIDPQDPANHDSIFFNNHVELIPGAAHPGGAVTEFVWHKINHFQHADGTLLDCILTDTVEITAFDLYQDVQAGIDDAVCENEYELLATEPNPISNPPHDYYTTGEWSVTFGNGDFDDVSFFNSWVRNIAAFDNIYRWTLTNHDLNCIMSDDVWIHSARPSGATAGPDQVICTDFTVLPSNVPLNYTSAYWNVAIGSATILGNSCTGFACDALATNIGLGSNTFVWTVTNEYTGPYGGFSTINPLVCSAVDSTVVINRSVIAAAGPDLYICGDFTALAANDPAGETGVWAGSGTFDDSGTNTSTLFNDVVRGLGRGKNTFTWTISNDAGCHDADQTVVWGLLPPVPYANIDTTVCADSVYLNANDVRDYWSVVDPVPPNTVWQDATVTGNWSSSNSSITFLNATNFNTTANGISPQTEVAFIWHSVTHFTDYVSGTIVPDCELTDTMLVYNNSVTATAGADMFECGVDLVVNSFNLNAAPVPAPASGVWSHNIGPLSTIVTPPSPTTLVTNVTQDNIYVYQWTVSATRNTVTCSANDSLIVEVRIPTQAVVNPTTNEVCINQSPLVGNAPISGNGTWSSMGSPGTINDPTSNGTYVDLVQNGVSQWKWTIDRLGCTSEDIITVTNNTVTSDADLFLDPNTIDICDSEYILNATDPSIFNIAMPLATGNWAGGIFDNNSVFNTTVRNLSTVSTNTLTWTVTKGSCSEWSTITINNNEFSIDADVNSIANEIYTCNSFVNLDAEQVGTGTGKWEKIGGGGATIQQINLFNTQVSNLTENDFSTFVWTVLRNGCQAKDTVNVFYNFVEANAGVDIEICDYETDMNAGQPDIGNSGVWSWVGPNASNMIVNNSYNSHATNILQGTNIFTWTVSKTVGGLYCEHSNDVNVINNAPDPFIIEANKESCDNFNTISVNISPVIGTGLWTTTGTANIFNNLAINTAVTDLDVGNNEFTWAVTHQWGGAPSQKCVLEDNIIITNNTVISKAGVDQTLCQDFTNLAAVDPSTYPPGIGSGYWGIPGNASIITNTLLGTSSVTNLNFGNNLFRWVVEEGNCTSFDDVNIANHSVDAVVTQSTIDLCSIDLPITLPGVDPVVNNGIWTLQGTSTGNIITPSAYNSSFGALADGNSSTLNWRVWNADCDDSETILINNQSFSVSAGSDQDDCSPDFTMAGATPAGTGSGAWTFFGGTGGGVIQNSTDENTQITGITPGGSSTFVWTVTRGACHISNSVVLTNNSPSNAVISIPLASNREICSNSVNIEAINPSVGTGLWECGTGATFANPNNYQTTINNLAYGPNLITWTVSNGALCASQVQMTITNNEVLAKAGNNQNSLCQDFTSLDATDPVTDGYWGATGFWTREVGGAVITNSLQNNTLVTGLSQNHNRFKWRVEKGICWHEDFVDIYNLSVTASATDKSDCFDTYILDGNDPLSFGGSGYWEVVTGSNGVITAPNTLFNTTVTGIPNGISSSLRWNVTNGTCSDDIEINVTNNNFSLNAGISQNLCKDSTQLNGKQIIGGSGQWEMTSGLATTYIDNTTIHNPYVTGLRKGSTTFTWTVTRNSCTNSATVFITNDLPSTANITDPLNTETCDGTITLVGEHPSPYYADNQYWTQISGAGNFVNPSTFTLNVTNLGPGANYFRWTVENSVCPANKDFITIYNNEVIAIAGNAQANLCEDHTFLNATNPSSIPPKQGIGYWKNISFNGALISNSLLPGTEVTNLPKGTTTFLWTVEKGTCTADSIVQVTNNLEPALASDIIECDGNMILTGNDPSSFGTGLWTIIVGTGNVTAPNTLFNTTITGVSNGTISTLQWLVDNGICKDSTTIVVENNNFDLSAGLDYSGCEDNYTFTADDPLPGTGYWSVLGGSGNITNSALNTSYVDGLSQGANVFVWHVTKDGCDNTSQVTIDNNNPDAAVIGAPGVSAREICTNSVNLQANNPTYGVGAWSVSAGAGTFNMASNNNTVVSGLNPGPNTFKWTITNGACNVSDEITIINNAVTAQAGAMQDLCKDSTNLAAQLPTYGNGSWTYIGAGSVTIENSLLQSSKVTDLNKGINTFRWTVVQGICDEHEDVVINNYSVEAIATNNTQTCSSDITLAAISPALNELGTWSVPFAGITFDDNTLFNTIARNLLPGNNSITWRIDNGHCYDDTSINVRSIVPLCISGSDKEICTDGTHLQANDPSPGIGTWTCIGGSANFVDANDPNTFVNNIGLGINVFRWQVNESGCISESTLKVTNNTPVAYAGNDFTTCDNFSNLPAIQQLPTETAFWQTIGGNGMVTNSNLHNSGVTNLSHGINTFKWTVENGICTNTDQIAIYNNAITSISAGINQAICDNHAQLSALSPKVGEIGTWHASGGSAIVDNSNQFNTTVSNLSLGTNQFTWTISNGTCTAVDNVDIVNNLPSTPSTDPDQEICITSKTINVTSPAFGETGVWSNELGAQGIIVSSTNPTTVVHSIGPGTNTFRWTVSNALCNTHDDIVITNNTITTSAGLDQSRCQDTTVLAANNPGSNLGYWQLINPISGPVFDNSLAYNTIVRNLSSGANTFMWTVTNGSCSADDLVTISNSLPSTADAGADRTECDGTTILSANNPTIGTGVWTRLGGAGIIANSLHYNTAVTGLGSGGNTFRWTVSYASCTSYSDVLVMNNPIFASAGQDEPICGDSYPQLNGNQPAAGETGIWTVTGGSGVFAIPTLYNTSVSGLSGGDNRLTWTVSNGVCSNSDDIVLRDDTPSEPTVSSDREICLNYVTISGNQPVTGVGHWSVEAGTGIFDNTAANTTTVRQIAKNNTFRWNITKGLCENHADVHIINNSVIATVGDTIKVCGEHAFLNGNDTLIGETGTWIVTSGAGILANSTKYNTPVSNLTVGLNKFRWTISNGKCSDHDDLVVINDLYEAHASVAGPTTICKDFANIQGNIPIQSSTGHWEIYAGRGLFDDSTSPSTRVSFLNKGQNTIRWFITKGNCQDFEDISITNNMVIALAGVDVITCGNDANLSANDLLDSETGLWTLEAGGGNILTPSNNETIITGPNSGVNVFKWTVSGNGCFANDDVQINENSFNIEAGPTQTVCSTVASLTGENPSPGTGLWSTGSGVIINNLTNYLTTVTGLHDNSPHTFRWTVDKNGCTAYDEVVVNNHLVHADAGDDNTTCTSDITLHAVPPVAGIGIWSFNQGSGTITTPSYNETTLTGLSLVQSSLTWTVTHSNCSDADNVIVINNTVTAIAGIDQALCGDFTNLAGTPPKVGGYGLWEVIGGPGILQTPSAYNSSVTNLQRGTNTFRWTVYENGCDNHGDRVQVVNNTFDAFAGLDQTLTPLDTDTYFNADDLTTSTSGQWSVFAGSGDINDDLSPSSFVSNMPTGTNTFSWTVYNSATGCTDTDEVDIVVANFTPYAGVDSIICHNYYQLNARVEPGAETHTWSIVSGAGQFDNVNDANTYVRNINYGLNVFRWTVTFVGYSASDEVNITNDSIFVTAGDDDATCETFHTMNAGRLIGAVSTNWTPVAFGGGGTIENNSAWNTLVTDLAAGPSYFEWHVSNGHCESRDTVQIIYKLPPIALFEVDDDEFCAPQLVTINNTSTQYGGQSPPDMFGWVIEGETLANTYSVDDDIQYNFTNIGEGDSIYNIRLVATDYETNCTDTFTSIVTAHGSPLVDFYFTPNIAQRLPDATWEFVNTSAVDLNEYQWDFGNGTNQLDTEFNRSFLYEYFNPGTYVVSLTGTSGGQCNSLYTDTIVVLPACPSSYNFGGLVEEGCEDLDVQFYDNIDHVDNKFTSKWFFFDVDKDKIPSNLTLEDLSTYDEDPPFTYTEPGTYHPYFIAWNDACGSENLPYFTRYDTVVVYPNPIVDFDVAPYLVMLPEQTLSCLNYTIYGDRYLWDFGDGTSYDTHLEFPSHLYTEAGVYQVSLSVWSEHDCFSKLTDSIPVVVEEKGSIDFPDAFTPNLTGGNGGVYPCGGKYRVDQDNLNDVFFPKQSGVVSYTLEIYNRWGEKIFISNELCTGWDGYVDGVLAPQDVYVWKVSVRYRNGSPDKAYGSVTLLR